MKIYYLQRIGYFANSSEPNLRKLAAGSERMKTIYLLF